MSLLIFFEPGSYEMTGCSTNKSEVCVFAHLETGRSMLLRPNTGCSLGATKNTNVQSTQKTISAINSGRLLLRGISLNPKPPPGDVCLVHSSKPLSNQIPQQPMSEQCVFDCFVSGLGTPHRSQASSR